MVEEGGGMITLVEREKFRKDLLGLHLANLEKNWQWQLDQGYYAILAEALTNAALEAHKLQEISMLIFKNKAKEVGDGQA